MTKMLKPISATALALLTVTFAAPQNCTNIQPEASFSSIGNSPCDALIQAGLGHRLLLPTNDSYTEQIESWWSLNARQHPWCLVLPHTTQEVSTALTTLVQLDEGAGDWHIAVRSGGHSLSGNNIDNGVTIDLSMMNSSTYDKVTNLASIEPGARWADAYADLLDQGVSAVGGRDGGVGVGGFLLGGGNSFFSARKGFGCDNVMNYQVVLANGSVVNANRDQNSDLWRALKGGSGNFGIVTRFDVEAFPAKNIPYGIRIMESRYSDQFVDAIVDFAGLDRSYEGDALVPFYQHDTSISNTTAMFAIRVNTFDDANSTAFDNIDRIPALEDLGMVSKTHAAAADGSRVPPGHLATEFTIMFKNDPAVLKLCVQLHEELIKTTSQSIGADNFTSQLFFQPIPKFFGDIGREKGGNMLGLDAVTTNAILYVVGIGLKTNEQDLAVAHQRMGRMVSEIERYAASVGADVPFVYLNYADASQDALGSYGEDIIRHMRQVAQKYDPQVVFQRPVPGGFKISRLSQH